MSEPRPMFVHLLPGPIAEALVGGVAVVVDVLRATTTMVHALAAGCAAVVPCREIDEARQAAGRLPAGSALLGGERDGLPIPGFDLGNSPSSCTPEGCGGKTLIMTTTNGTRAILASLEAERVLVAGFVNAGATARCLVADGRPVHVVCSGTDGRISLEDAMLAGLLTTLLQQGGGLEPANDPALIARGLWADSARTLREGRAALADLLGRGRGGRRVQALGLQADLADAARLDRFDLVAELRRDPLRIVRAEAGR